MPVDHTEKNFEQVIEHCLLTGGYRKDDPASFDAALAVDRSPLIEFLKDSQPEEWSKLASIYGKDVEMKVVKTLPPTSISGGFWSVYGIPSAPE